MNKISVIIPAYNCENTIRNAIKSILDTNKADIEVIAVVNNCVDNTLSVCEDIRKEYSSVVVIDSKAKNVSEARNIGLKAISGDFIGFCDADDYFVPGAMDSLLDSILKNEADVIACGYSRVSVSGEIISTNKLSGGIKNIEDVRADILNNPSLLGTVWNKLYRMEVLEGIYFDEDLTHCEDTEYNLRILKKNDIKVIYSDDIFYNYVWNPQSVSNDENKSFDAEDKLRYLYAIEKIMEDNRNDKRILKYCGLKIATLCIDNYSENLSETQKDNLRKLIKENIKYLVINAGKYESDVNKDRLLKSIRILLKRI